METFWPSSSNKIKLQHLLRQWIITNASQRCPGVQIILSGTGVAGTDSNPCQCIVGLEQVAALPDLDADIEEADLRLIPHAFHATQEMAKRVVILSNDTDVLVLGLHYFHVLCHQGMKELWMRGGVGDSTRYIPLHTLAEKIGHDMCQVLPALHTLTGCDTTSKVGTKAAALKAKPLVYLKDFGKNLNNANTSLAKTEEYLVQVFKNGVPYATMDELRYYIYHHAKNVTFAELPPTSHALRAHILHAFHATYLQLNCLGNCEPVDPRQFGFEEEDGLLKPTMNKRLIPDDLPQSCTCTKCATHHCLCQELGVPCCIYCKCQGFALDGTLCKNPNIILRVPVQVPLAT